MEDRTSLANLLSLTPNAGVRAGSINSLASSPIRRGRNRNFTGSWSLLTVSIAPCQAVKDSVPHSAWRLLTPLLRVEENDSGRELNNSSDKLFNTSTKLFIYIGSWWNDTSHRNKWVLGNTIPGGGVSVSFNLLQHRGRRCDQFAIAWRKAIPWHSQGQRRLQGRCVG